MDFSGATTARRTSIRPLSHKDVARRAYLDTYAKRRAGLEVDALPVQEEQTVQITPLVKPMQPSVQVAALPVQNDLIEQPAYTPPVLNSVESAPTATVPITTEQPTLNQAEFTYTSQPTAVAMNTPVAVTAPQEEATSRSYLDTLIHRHKAAVAAAPEALETVTAPVQFATAEDLIDDTLEDDKADTQKIEANLRALYDTSLTKTLTKSTQSASAAHVRTIVTSALACGILSVGIFTFMARVDSPPIIAQPIGSPVIEVEAPAEQPRTSAAPAVANDGKIVADPSHPVRIVVSKAGINAPIEGYGVTAEGAMAVPESWGIVGWYNKGVVPGKAGPAVLAGHYSGTQGAVFDKLGSLENGDLITITNGYGENFTYKVTKKTEYHRDQVPMAEIFKKGDTSRLEIITCAGRWYADNYDNRLVVTAEIVR